MIYERKGPTIARQDVSFESSVRSIAAATFYDATAVNGGMRLQRCTEVAHLLSI